MALEPQVELATNEQKVSYGFGLQFGHQLRKNRFDGMDIEAIVAGMRHIFEHNQAQLTDAELNPAYQAVQDRKTAEAAQMAEQRQQLADQFMTANANREEVSTTDSGLQWEVLESGTAGDKPELTSEVVTHYHGTFVDGTVFDSSVERGEPATFGVNQVIPGWTEALQMMSPGDKWRIACPPKLAYGPQGAGDAIPPNTALVFEIHLIAIN